MSRERGMFRIYHCSKCNNIGFSQVESEESISSCSLCQTMILHEVGTIYAVTREEAKTLVLELAFEAQTSRVSARGGSGRGLGIKRRVYNIIKALIDIKRGKPVSIEEVMRECSEAGIDLGRALKFLDNLESEGFISNDGVNIVITKGVKPDV